MLRREVRSFAAHALLVQRLCPAMLRPDVAPSGYLRSLLMQGATRGRAERVSTLIAHAIRYEDDNVDGGGDTTYIQDRQPLPTPTLPS